MEYKRLTEKTIGCFQYDLKDFKHKVDEFNDYDAFFAYSMAVKRLGELEDKIKAGTLIELPKIGQILYGVIPWRKEVREITVDNIGIFSDCIVVWDTYDDDYVLNEYAFYTEAEAEKRLEEIRNEKNTFQG